jgi:hypothetical protein
MLKKFKAIALFFFNPTNLHLPIYKNHCRICQNMLKSIEQAPRGGIKMKKMNFRKIMILLISFSLLFTSGMTFAYWASFIFGNSDDQSQNIDIGNWFDAIPIFTAEEFIEVITTNMNTESYVIAKNIDFGHITPAEWPQTKDIVFKGSINGLNKTLSNIDLTNYTGIFGILENATLINMHFNHVTINYTLNDSLSSGILAGRLQGNQNLIENITISNSSVSNTHLISGGLIGSISLLSGSSTATIKNVTITNTIISGGSANINYGNGGLIGTINQTNLILENIDLSVNVTSTSNSNAGGVIGSVIGTSQIALDQTGITNSIITASGTSINLGSGGIVGLLQGTNHTFVKTRVTNSTITSQSSSGGVIGLANQTSGTATINNTKIKGSNISSQTSDNTLGAGGLIGNSLLYTMTVNDLYVESTIHTNNANVGGAIGHMTSGNITINRSVIFSDIIINNPTNSTDRGAASIVGRNAGLITANHTFFRGYLKARVQGNGPYVGIIKAIGTDITFTNSRSAEVSYFLANNNQFQLVDTLTRYNNMRGQNAGFNDTHTVLMTSINQSYWTTNYSTITNSSLWAYNTTTRLYELID